MADIKAAADQRRVDSATGQSGGDRLEGNDRLEGADWVHILARRIAPGHDGPAGAAPVGGSFNPHVARQLMVGERVKPAFTFEL
ncbi:MAG: hypothetical protein AB7E05_02865 [Sphingobium sp.]